MHSPARQKIAPVPAPPEEAKMRSARSARHHALSAHDLAVTPEDRAAFEEMKAGYEAEVQPVGHLQQELFDQLLNAAWTLRHFRRQAAHALAEGDEAAYGRWERHRQRHEAGYHRALKMLRTLQTDRAVRCLPEHQHLESLPDTVEPGKLLREMMSSARRTHRPTQFKVSAAPLALPYDAVPGPLH